MMLRMTTAIAAKRLVARRPRPRRLRRPRQPAVRRYRLAR